MEIGQLFEVGAEWKHREREFLVTIKGIVEPGRYSLSFVNKTTPGDTFEPVDFMTRAILNGTWTAEELVRDFDPMPVRATRYDLIHDDDLFEDV